MSFKIKTKEGNPLSMHTLDAEACRFWVIPRAEKSYAKAFGMFDNWYDVIGFNIHCLKINGDVSWNLVVAEMYDTFGVELENIATPNKEPEGKYDYSVTKATVYLLPCLQLISHWRFKGYQAECIT